MLHTTKTRTKLLSLLLTLVMLLTTAVPAFAAGSRSFTLRGVELPEQLTVGEPFELGGTLRGRNSLSRVIVTVLDWEEDELFRKTFRPSGKTFYLHSVNKYLDFDELLCGAYTLTVEVKNKYVGRITVIEQAFTVAEEFAVEDDLYVEEETPAQEDVFVTTTFAETESCVMTFSLKEDGDKYISKNFKIKEFASPGTDEILIDIKLVAALQQARDYFNAPVNITSGYRSPSYNSTLNNAASNSYHTRGMAADISVAGVDPLTVCQFFECIGVHGCGWYPYGEGYFTHVDTRPASAHFYWTTHSQLYVSSFYRYS